MSDGESFAAMPPSVTELRANRSEDGGDWTPRDVLIATLREIDSGRLKPDALIICMREPAPHLGPGACATSMKNAVDDPLVAYGLLLDTIMSITMEAQSRRR